MPGVRSPERSGLMARKAQAGAVGRSNSGMHPTADTRAVIYFLWGRAAGDARVGRLVAETNSQG